MPVEPVNPVFTAGEEKPVEVDTHIREDYCSFQEESA
jgi:hypothetical protein